MTPLQTGRPDKPNTRRLRPPTAEAESDEPDTTDYELSASTILPPAVHFVPPDGPAATPEPGLDAAARRLFHQRLGLCCLVAAAPFLFFFVCSASGFIELFSRAVVGITGVVLSGAVLGGLLATASVLHRLAPLSENVLRAVEIAAFGAMGLFFAYWQFSLLTSNLLRASSTPPLQRTQGPTDPVYLEAVRAAEERDRRQEQYAVLAAALVVHFNWFALLVFHAVLVPNTAARGAGVAGAMLAAALAIDAVAVSTHDPTYRNALVLFAVAAAMLAAGALLSVFGTAKTAALREEVDAARQAIRELGQYRLRRKLGQGGMGEVYLAEHRLLKRPCAVKRIHSRCLNNPEQVRRFEREVQTTAKLRHPNTVEVYDYGRADDGTFYYVMEYLPGLSLEDIVNKYGPLPPPRAIHILRQVCGALREAHRHGLVHRDVKPSNIIVLPEGVTHDHAKVLDFGLVQSLAADDPEAKITRDGLIVGTPEYMSPEQAQGQPLDERSDLFSLGTVAYFLLTGQEAFHRENPVKTLLAVVNEEPRPLLAANPLAPADVAAVIARCLTKAPAARYAEAGEVDAALARCAAAGGWTAAAAAAWWELHPKGDGTGTDLDSLPVRGSEG